MAKTPKFGKSPSRARVSGGLTNQIHTAPTQVAGQYKFPGMPVPRGQGAVPGKGGGKGKGLPARGLRKSPVAF